MAGLLTGGLLGPVASTGRLGMVCIDTRLPGGDVGLAMPSPLVGYRLRLSAISSPSSSNTVDGVLRPTTVASLCTRVYPGRAYGGLDGEACETGLNPSACELEEKPSDGSAGVLFVVSRSGDSLMSGRRSAIMTRRASNGPRCLRFQPAACKSMTVSFSCSLASQLCDATRCSSPCNKRCRRKQKYVSPRKGD